MSNIDEQYDNLLKMGDKVAEEGHKLTEEEVNKISDALSEVRNSDDDLKVLLEGMVSCENEETTKLQVLNDPNVTITIIGNPDLIRKITPKEYTYQAPASIGPVELDYTLTVVNASDKRVYNLLASDKMRGRNDLIVLWKKRMI